MRRSIVLVVILLAASLGAGCTAPAPREDVAPAAVEEAAPELVLAPLVEGPPLRALRASIALDDEWLKPLRPVRASLEAEPDARVAWFVSLAEEDPFVDVVEGNVFVSKASTPIGHHHHAGETAEDEHGAPPPGRSRADVGALSAARPRAVRMDLAGRFVLAAGDARLDVHVWPGAPRETVTQATLVQDAAGRARFVPDALALPVGTRMQLWSQLEREAQVREVGYAAFVPLDARDIAFTPTDEGLFALRALVHAPGARGVAAAPFLVDFERPSDRLALGPWTGRLTQGEGAAEERVFGARATYPLESFELWFNASSALPAPASIVVIVEREGEPLAQASSVSEQRISLADLPAGGYTVTVRGEHGALVGFEVAGEARYQLPTPARLRESAP